MVETSMNALNDQLMDLWNNRQLPLPTRPIMNRQQTKPMQSRYTSITKNHTARNPHSIPQPSNPKIQPGALTESPDADMNLLETAQTAAAEAPSPPLPPLCTKHQCQQPLNKFRSPKFSKPSVSTLHRYERESRQQVPGLVREAPATPRHHSSG